MYLQQQANQHQRDGIATIHVLIEVNARQNMPALQPVLGYYSLSAAQLLLSELSQADQARLPKYPIPAVRMGRLAVATAWQKQGLGEYLIGHAVSRCLSLRDELGVRVLLVDALNPSAANFYLAYGFQYCQVPGGPLYLNL